MDSKKKSLRDQVIKILEKSCKLKNPLAKKIEALIFEKTSKDEKLTKKYQNVCYQIIGRLHQCKTPEERKVVLEDLPKGHFGWDSNLWKPYEEKENLRYSEKIKLPKVKPGIFKCRKCGQKECEFYQLQTRSGDEAMTTFVTCCNCGNKWRE